MNVKYRKITVGEVEKIIPQIKNPTDKISYLKICLSETDYQAIKFAEGEMSASEFAPMKAKRSAWRAEINRLQNS